MRTWLQVFGAIALIWLVGATAGQAQVTLRWKLQPSDKLHYAIVSDSTMSFRSGDLPFALVQRQTVDLTWEVQAVDEQGTVTFTQTAERMRFMVKWNDQQPMNYDSDTKDQPQDPIGKMLTTAVGALVKQPIQLKMAADGRLVELNLPAAIREKLKQAGSTNQLGTFFSEEGMKRMFDLMQLPDEPVTEGMSWQRESEISDPATGKQLIATTFTYAGSEDQDGQALEKISLSMKLDLKPAAGQPLKTEIKEQESKGLVLFDNTAGRLVSSKTESKLVFSMMGPGGKPQASALETTMTAKLQPAMP